MTPKILGYAVYSGESVAVVGNVFRPAQAETVLAHISKISRVGAS